MSVTQKEISKGICMEGQVVHKNIIFLLRISPHSQLIHNYDAQVHASLAALFTFGNSSVLSQFETGRAYSGQGVYLLLRNNQMLKTKLKYLLEKEQKQKLQQ